MSSPNNLSSALAKAQAEMLTAPKNGYNPHFKNNFSTLEDLIEASRPALTKYGLSVTQYPDSTNDSTYLVTKLKHESGEEEVSRVQIFLKDPTDLQKLGSALSYLKRYAYAAICGIATSENDDDGNSNTGPAPTEYINDKQFALLRGRLKGNSLREKAICEYYKISTLAELPWRKMQEVINRLDKPDNNHE